MKQPRVVDYEHVHMTHDRFRAPGDGSCCYGAAFSDGENCTCWEPAVEPHETEQLQHGPMDVRRHRCGDCAYRRDSPERQAIGGDTMPYQPNGVFLCHDGMPKVTKYVHPDGAEVPAGEGEHADYRPVERGAMAWQADGRPAIVCAGWAADNRAYYEARQLGGTTDGH